MPGGHAQRQTEPLAKAEPRAVVYVALWFLSLTKPGTDLFPALLSMACPTWLRYCSFANTESHLVCYYFKASYNS